MTKTRNHEKQRESIRRALRMVTVSLPHLSELAGFVRVTIDERVGSAGIFPSGHLLIHPDFLDQLSLPDLTFVLAHELLHLALRTHERGEGTDMRLVNTAHDYIINDILAHELGTEPPAGGLTWPDARFLSLEEMVRTLRDEWEDQQQPSAWGFQGEGSSSDMRHDVLSGDLEQNMFPDSDANAQKEAEKQVQQAAEKGAMLGQLIDSWQRSGEKDKPGQQAGNFGIIADARGTYRPPWERALQRWFDATAPQVRTFSRPSRRGANRKDVVLPGRKREGTTLNIILDCSGSMEEDLGRALGAISSFCDAVGIEQVRVLQCDSEVTKDEFVTTEKLSRYAITGLGGTDMSPAMEKLADDPEVESVILLTDEDVMWAPIPEKQPPYTLLWVLMRPVPEFQPPYGEVITMEPRRS